MKKTVLLLSLNVMLYLLIAYFFIPISFWNRMTLLMLACLNMIYTNRLYQIIRFYRENGEQLEFAKDNFWWDIAFQGLMVAAVLGIAWPNYGTLPIYLSCTWMLQIITSKQILVGKQSVFYGYKSYDREYLKDWTKLGTKKGHTHYQTQQNGKIQDFHIKTEYGVYFGG